MQALNMLGLKCEFYPRHTHILQNICMNIYCIHICVYVYICDIYIYIAYIYMYVAYVCVRLVRPMMGRLGQHMRQCAFG